MPRHTPAEKKKRRAALQQAGKRAVTGRAADRSLRKAARATERLTEEPTPKRKRKKK